MIKEFINWIAFILGGFCGFFFGGLDALVIAIIVFIIVDYITGVLCAVYNKKLNSSTGFRGLLRKAVILIVISVGHMADFYLFGNGEVIRNACIFFYISNEGISILENVVAMNVPVPKMLREVLEQINEEEADDGKQSTD